MPKLVEVWEEATCEFLGSSQNAFEHFDKLEIPVSVLVVLYIARTVH